MWWLILLPVRTWCRSKIWKIPFMHPICFCKSGLSSAKECRSFAAISTSSVQISYFHSQLFPNIYSIFFKQIRFPKIQIQGPSVNVGNKLWVHNTQSFTATTLHPLKPISVISGNCKWSYPFSRYTKLRSCKIQTPHWPLLHKLTPTSSSSTTKCNLSFFLFLSPEGLEQNAKPTGQLQLFPASQTVRE